jgi:NAD(P)-dependent dehydrogenase (short-subunit alcohol dehydrogenase family)
MAKLCEGRIVVVTGAGRGLGRAHALEFARQGAKVVVNDLGVSRDGKAPEDDAAAAVVKEIEALGGEAIANRDDVADFAAAGRIVQAAVDKWGRLDVVVNNAGFLRDRMFVNVTEDEWDAVIRVHMRGHFCVSSHAANHWRARSKKGETNIEGRLIHTSSGAGLMGSVGQTAYSAAKAGILGMTLVMSAELARIGVTVNALAPAARTRMTEPMYGATMAENKTGFDAFAPENVAPLVAWLGSIDSSGVTGQVFDVQGGLIRLMEGWHPGPSVDQNARWEPAKIGPVVRDLLSQARKAEPVYSA